MGVFPTHSDAPRVLIANALLVPHWATDEVFWDLEQRGLTMYGQMTAGSWIYIGSQGIVQGTYETFFSVANQHFNGDPSGRFKTGFWAAHQPGRSEIDYTSDELCVILEGVVRLTDSAGHVETYRAGDTFLIIDENGVAGYQASQDLVIELINGTHLSALSLSNFESVG